MSGLVLRGLTVRSSGGDGIYVAGVTNGLFSELVLNNHFRQGVSIISATNVLFEDCVFSNTGVGAASSPACGVDLEPNYAVDRLQNITFRRCLAANNTACGFTISPHNLLHTTSGPPVLSAAVGITFEDCAVDARG